MRRKSLSERPNIFSLNRNHPLAQGLMFAGLQQYSGSEQYIESSAYNISSKLTNCDVVSNWIYDSILHRMVLKLDGINDFIDITIPPITSIPCSIVSWFNVTSTNTIYTIAAVSDYNSPGVDYHIMLELSRGTLGRVGASTWSISGATAVSNDSFTANTWFHGAAVFAATNNRVAYINGKPGSAETTNLTPVGIDRGQLGCNRVSTTSLYRLFSGKMTDALFYNRVLSLSEIQQLADPTNIMLSGLLQPPKRIYYGFNNTPQTRRTFLLLTTGNKSLFIYK